MPPELNKKPKPSKEFFDTNLPEPPNVPDNLFAGPGAPSNRPPTFKEKIERLLKTGAIAN